MTTVPATRSGNAVTALCGPPPDQPAVTHRSAARWSSTASTSAAAHGRLAKRSNVSGLQGPTAVASRSAEKRALHRRLGVTPTVHEGAQRFQLGRQLWTAGGGAGDGQRSKDGRGHEICGDRRLRHGFA
jgi:hypothetical protein